MTNHEDIRRDMGREWNWHPELPVQVTPLFDWPPDPRKTLKWFAENWLPVSEYSLYVLLAYLIWSLVHPSYEASSQFAAGWVLSIWLRNLLLMLIFGTGLHLWLYTWSKQGKDLKYDHRGLAQDNGTFLFRNQLWDNVFWSLASGVSLLTLFEVVIWWALANGYAPAFGFAEHPVWFFLCFPLIPIFNSFHFYCVHRLLHTQLLYDRFHSLHHRNVSVGPWSGFSMHPVEHMIYLSSLFIHVVVPTHPMHLLFHVFWISLATLTTHSGYERLILGDTPSVKIGSFFHQLHHRYFECNYGSLEMPWDRWFGSHHDGSAEATEKVRERRRRKNRGI